VRHDLRIVPEHDVIVRVLPALPALLAHPVVPDGPAYRSGAWFDHTDDFIRANIAAGKLQRVVFLSRLVPMVEWLAIAWLVLWLGTRLFGAHAGILSSALWLSTPVLVGFGHLVSIDVSFTLATLGLSAVLLRYLESPSLRRVALVGAVAGAALLARHLGLLLVAVAGVVVVAEGWKRARSVALKHAAVLALVAWSAVWIVVRLLATPPSGETAARFDGIIAASRSDSLVSRLVLAVPWPKEWAAGFGFLVLTSMPRPAYLLGSAWDGGRWWYFLGATLVKVPLPVLGAVVLGLLGWRRVPKRDARNALAVVALPAVVLYAAVASQPLNLGLRYAFPTLALLFVAAGPVVLLGTPFWRRVGAGVLVVSQVAALAVSYPHPIAWGPPPFTPSYRWSTDSNVDYGQDTAAVEAWAKGRTPLVALLAPRGFESPAGMETSPSPRRCSPRSSATSCRGCARTAPWARSGAASSSTRSTARSIRGRDRRCRWTSATETCPSARADRR
jgi:hypothetical protein